MLLTKLHIPVHGNNIVHRPRLFELLNSGLQRKLILVSAPAGYGKTTLISYWIGQNNIPAVWLSLDKGDNDPSVFLSYIIKGIQTIRHDFGQGAFRLLNTPNSPSVESIASLLINELLSINQNVLLVLDDFHQIRNNEVLKLITYFLEHISVNTHIVILTRSDPALSLSRIRSQNQLVELRSAELGFTANDIFVLFNKKLKIGLSRDDAYVLETKTEGWIAGLQLAALSMHGRDDLSEFVRDLKGDNRYIMDYLIEEVLKIQTDGIKDFLLQTSILEQMSAPLCNTILKRSDSQVILETLENENMFVIPLDNERNWYRYHHLFAELLKQRLYSKNKELIRELHDAAGEWFKNNSMPLFAIDHAIETRNFEKSVAILGEMAEELWKTGQHATLMKYGDFLPDELIKKNTNLSLYYAWILIIAGKNQRAEQFLECAGKITNDIINHKDSSYEAVQFNKRILGKISVAFACLYAKTAFPQNTLNYCKAAMVNLTEEDSFWNSWAWYSIGWAEEVSGHISESIDAVEKALYYGKKSGSIYLITTNAYCVAYLEQRMGLYTSAYRKCSELLREYNAGDNPEISELDPGLGQIYMCIAEIECMRTDFDAAFEHIKVAYTLCRNFSNSSVKVWVRLIYSLILFGRGDFDGIMQLLVETEDIINKNTVSPSARAIYIDMKGKQLVDNNEYENAHRFFKMNGLSPEKEISFVEDRGFFSFVILLIKEGKNKEAETILSKLEIMLQGAKWIETLISVKIIYAILQKNAGDNKKAVICLLKSLELASDEGILMPFIFYYDWIKDLIPDVYKIQASEKTNIPRDLTEKLKQAIEKRNKIIRKSLKAELSTRELEVLRYLSGGLRNKEIADKLFVSIDTVKTHVRNILLKLEVDSRLRAVKKAKELGLT